MYETHLALIMSSTSICMIPYETMPHYMSCQFGVSSQNLYRVIVLVTSSGAKYLHHEHEYESQFGPFAIPSGSMLHCSYPAVWNYKSL